MATSVDNTSFQALRDLPLDIWHLIFTAYLRPATQRELLLTSRAFRLLALPALFSTLDLQLAGPAAGPLRRIREDRARTILENVAGIRRTRDQHTDTGVDTIRQTFACAIVNLRIHFGDGGLVDKERWYTLLGQTFTNLTNLRSVEWRCSPLSTLVMPKRLIVTLRSSCTNLDTFVHVGGLLEQHHLGHLHGLKKLVLRADSGCRALATAFEANADTLRELSVTTAVMPNIPEPIIARLTHLTIYSSLNPDLLATIFLEAKRLRSLAVRATPDDFLDQIVLEVVAHMVETYDVRRELEHLRLVGIPAAADELFALWLDHCYPNLQRACVLGVTSEALPNVSSVLGAANPVRVLGLTCGVVPADTQEVPVVPSSVETLYLAGHNTSSLVLAKPLPNLRALFIDNLPPTLSIPITLVMQRPDVEVHALLVAQPSLRAIIWRSTSTSTADSKIKESFTVAQRTAYGSIHVNVYDEMVGVPGEGLERDMEWTLGMEVGV